MSSAEISGLLEEIAVLLELKGENPFKIRAYRNAARKLEEVGSDLAERVERGSLEELEGIGKALAEKITALARTGRLEEYERLRSETPEGLLDLLKVAGLGPKKVRALHEKLGIYSLDGLEKACRGNRIAMLEGFGLKTQEKILAGIANVRKNQDLFLFAEAIDLAEEVKNTISGWREVLQVSLAGSLRRRNETVRDVDIVCSSRRPKAVMEKFTKLPGVVRVTEHGETKSRVVFERGLAFDLRVVTEEQFPFALQHFTGSREHNTKLRALAKKKGFKLNEYGLFRGTKLSPQKDEKSIFRALGLSFIPPELREDRGEIERAARKRIPTLVERSDLRGVFHVHSTYSDGRSTLTEMVEAAADAGLTYIGIADHSQTASYAGGLKEVAIGRQRREIDRLAKEFPKFRIFHGIESDILPDGSLDYPDRILRRFDFVIASVHSRFQMSEDEMTRRCLAALSNPHCTMLGHPTGRLLLERPAFAIDLRALIDRASEQKKIIELNAHPQRLDLDWRWLGYAKDKGVRISINPDAHDTFGFEHLRFGIYAARKGGLEAKDVLNTMPAERVENFLRGVSRG
ncbi:MAG: DNA polymerase/3'-5' exonuclease PolX [Pseudomonadota bacterium]